MSAATALPGAAGRATGLGGWIRDLGLGAQLAFRGARMRTALTAVGIGLAVAVLLFATALPTAIGHREDRVNAASYAAASLDPGKPPTRGLLSLNGYSQWKGEDVSGLLVQGLSAGAPTPPGIPRLPRAGETYVSPRLAQLLGDPANRLLAQRIPGRVVGTIDRSTLTGPRELRWYAGSGRLRGIAAAGSGSADTNVLRIRSFGGQRSAVLGPLLDLLVLVGTVVLLFPIAILVATASRFGSARRDRRLAALRLLGTSRAETTRIAAGESLAAATLGVVLGGVLLAAARLLVEHIHPLGFSLFTSDVIPNPVLALVAVVGVLGISVAATVLSLRRVSIEPLAVSRRAGADTRRRFWWRPVPIVVGLGLLLPLLGGAAVETDQHRVQIGIGAVAVLSGVVFLLPWLVEALVRRTRGWSVSSQLAIRTLQPEATAASRIVSGVAVAVAGSIALQMLILSATRADDYPTNAAPSSADQVVSVPGSAARVDELRAVLTRTRGVTAAHVIASGYLDADTGSNGVAPVVALAPCADLRELTTVTRCQDGDAFRAVTPSATFDRGGTSYTETTTVPGPGEVVRFSDPSGAVGHGPRWRTPSTLPTVQARLAEGRPEAGLYLTPGVRVPLDPATLRVRAFVHLDPGDPLAIERLRTAAFRFDPGADVSPNDTVDDHKVLVVRRSLLAGSALLLLLIAASLIVTTFEQLGERRRTLATLAAFGTPAKIQRRALWWQVAIPVTLGLVLALMIGVPLGAVLLRLQQEPFTINVPDTISLLAIGAGMVVLVLAAALPLLRRVAAPSALRTE